MGKMSRATRMLMLRSENGNRYQQNMYGKEEQRGEARYGGAYNNYGGEMGNEIENRFRDRRGREHYDNGRFAPMRSQYAEERMNNGGEARNQGIAVWDRGEARNGYSEMEEERYPPPVYREGFGAVNKIGFALPAEMNVGYRADATYSRMNEMEHHKGQKMMGYSKGRDVLTPEMAEEWTAEMKNKDGSKGPHWKKEDVKRLMEQRKIHKDMYEFWAVLNAVYSGFCAVAKKHGVNTMDFYVDMANAWMDDENAKPEKAAIYFREIVK